MLIYDMCFSNILKRCVYLFLYVLGIYNGLRIGRYYGDFGIIECLDF